MKCDAVLKRIIFTFVNKNSGHAVDLNDNDILSFKKIKIQYEFQQVSNSLLVIEEMNNFHVYH